MDERGCLPMMQERRFANALPHNSAARLVSPTNGQFDVTGQSNIITAPAANHYQLMVEDSPIRFNWMRIQDALDQASLDGSNYVLHSR